MSALRWTVERVLRVYKDARKVRDDEGDSVKQQISVLRALVKRPELQQVGAVLPDLATIKDLQRSGARWRSVADLASMLRKEDCDDLVSLAKAQIAPDPEMCAALFHLGVFGTVLGFLRSLEYVPVSLRPLHGGAKGPAYEVVDQAGQIWELWFEASAVWSDRNEIEPYVQATQGLKSPGKDKSADILLINHLKRRAIVIECKYSEKGDYIRKGYQQVLAYLTEFRTSMIDAGEAFVVVPSEVVEEPTAGLTHAGSVTFCAPEHLKDELNRALKQLQK